MALNSATASSSLRFSNCPTCTSWMPATSRGATSDLCADHRGRLRRRVATECASSGPGVRHQERTPLAWSRPVGRQLRPGRPSVQPALGPLPKGLGRAEVTPQTTTHRSNLPLLRESCSGFALAQPGQPTAPPRRVVVHLCQWPGPSARKPKYRTSTQRRCSALSASATASSSMWPAQVGEEQVSAEFGSGSAEIRCGWRSISRMAEFAQRGEQRPRCILDPQHHRRAIGAGARRRAAPAKPTRRKRGAGVDFIDHALGEGRQLPMRGGQRRGHRGRRPSPSADLPRRVGVGIRRP